MNKAAGIAAGVIVAVGVVATAGAWYTGTQVEGVLQNAVAQANQEFHTTALGPDGQPVISVALVSVERHLFSSTAHYRFTVHGKGLGENGEMELLFVDHLEHGPLPFSRLKSLNLMPVMATSNINLQPSPATARWYSIAKGSEPLAAHLNIHYGGAVQGNLALAPLDFKTPQGTFTFSGLDADLSVSDDAATYALTGQSANLQLDILGKNNLPIRMGFKGLALNLGGKRGESGFYLGSSDAKVASVLFQAQGGPALDMQSLSTTTQIDEANGMLAGQVNYAIGMINLADKPLGAAQVGVKFDQFDIPSSKSLYHLFQTQISPQQQAAARAGVPFKLQLSPADEQQMKVDAARFLSTKPHVELQNASLKTANGEGHLSLSVDLAPVPMGATAVAPFGGDIIGAIDAKVLLSKAMLSDLGIAQANMQGITDPAAIAQQGKNVSDMVSGLAVMLQLGKVDGDNVVSNLHYADGLVDFNGQKMTPQQFIANILGRYAGAQR